MMWEETTSICRWIQLHHNVDHTWIVHGSYMDRAWILHGRDEEVLHRTKRALCRPPSRRAGRAAQPACFGRPAARSGVRHPARKRHSQPTRLQPQVQGSGCTATRGSLVVQAILVVGNVLAPGRAVAFAVDLERRDVGHEAVWGCTVPVLLTRLEEHAVTGADDLDRPAATLHGAHTLGEVGDLAAGVGVPRCSGARREVGAARL